MAGEASIAFSQPLFWPPLSLNGNMFRDHQNGFILVLAHKAAHICSQAARDCYAAKPECVAKLHNP
jgi:hypothetical protein